MGDKTITPYKELTAIEKKDGTIITTAMSLQQLADMLKTNDFIVLGDELINKYEIKGAKKYIPNDMQMFIFSQNKEVSERLQAIYNERKEKLLPTNGVEHLVEIYTKRFGDITK